jgi:hypothetical protein
MWIVSRVACGLSQATKSTPDSIKFEIKLTLRASWSSLAMTNVARRNRTPRVRRRSAGGRFFRFDLLKLGDDHAGRTCDMVGNRFALRFQAQPRGALLRGRLARRATQPRRGPVRHFNAVPF